MQTYLKEYGTSAFCDVVLYKFDATALQTSVTFVSGCVLLSVDGGIPTSAYYLPIKLGNGFRINFTNLEMTGKSILVTISDQTGNQRWLDTAFSVETFGTSASMHPFIGSGLLNLNVDGDPLTNILNYLKALAVGNISKSGNLYTYSRGDGSPLFILSAGTSSGRQKVFG